MGKRKFKAEVQQVLDIVVHSLYSHREIFLRELISNASDAIDRARFESLSNKDILEDDPEWKIKLAADKDAKTLTISDNGLGMAADQIDECIGTIANSGTRRFLEEMKKQNKSGPELIGQFGVGFYSAFMVADKVTVLTRQAGAPDQATRWESDGSGTYTVESATKETRGTAITIHLKDDADEFLEEWRIRKIVKQYSDFVEYPIVMDIEREEVERDEDGKEIEGAERKKTVKEETLNSCKAIWTRPKSEIKEDEYKEFYRHVSHDFQDPYETIHWSVEGTTEFRALLYLPKKSTFDMFMPETRKRGIHLYIKRVFITDDCEFLMPQYLRFMKGVVDSSDLPLNVSREVLQDNRMTRLIQSNLVKKVLDTLGDKKEKDRDGYTEFFKEFGAVLKEGAHSDFANREKISDLLLYETSKTEAGKPISLAEYVERMPEDQDHIYYIVGDSRQALENSPHLETFRSHDTEVLLMTEPIDEWVVQSMPAYKEKTLKPIDRGDIDLDTGGDAEEKAEERKKAEEELKPLTDAIKEALGDKVKEVRLSNRLTESACCLAGDEHAMGIHMERIMKAMHEDMPPSRRILELNPAHAVIKTLEALHAKDAENAKIAEYAELLYDQAALTAGIPVDDPLQFARRVSNLMNAEARTLV